MTERLVLADSVVTGNASNDKGGGIASLAGELTIRGTTISNNQVSAAYADGGGIFAGGGKLTIERSTISGNGANAGGGVFASNGVITSISNSTLSDNEVSYFGGGLFLVGSTATISHTTIAENRAAGPIAAGGGVWWEGTSPNLSHTIVADNTSTNAGADLFSQLGNSLSATYSLIGSATGVTVAGVGNLLNTNPLLGPLADNGGPTLTHALLLGSPALNAGNLTTAPGFDQRGAGFPRVQFGKIDIGAYEYNDIAIPSRGLVVSTTSDLLDFDYSPGQFSLREAILLANANPGANTITFDAGMSGQTILLTGGELLVTDTLTIDAASLVDNVVIDGQQQSRVLNFISSISSNGGDLTLDGLTLQNGRTVADSTGIPDFTSNGGGIRFESSGTLAILNSTLSGNSTAGEQADGGGIFASYGTVMLTNTALSGNSTTGWLAGGGGIGVFRADVTLTNSTITGNSTTGEVGSGGGIYSNRGAVTLINSTLSGNSTSADDSAGGGIYAFRATVTLTNSTISGNSTTGASSPGGGIHSNDYAVTLTNSTVSGNSTSGKYSSGGGINASTVTLTNSTINGNSTTGEEADGGGIFSRDGAVTLTNSTISGNSTTGEEADGGGIFLFNSFFYNYSLTLTNSTVSGNSVSGINSVGGGIVSVNGSITITQSTVFDNHALHGNAQGGGIFQGDTTGNRPIAISGSILAGNTSGGAGANIVKDPQSSLTVNYSLIGTGAIPTSGGNNVNDNNPLLGPLADNGGLTFTHALLEGSSAINAGDPSFSSPPDYDQRGEGFARVSNGRIDIGAFEVQAVETLPGDFDQDGDVDGRDFLLWQRNMSVGELGDWQENYGEVGPGVGGQVSEILVDDDVLPFISAPAKQSVRGYFESEQEPSQLYVEEVDRAIEQFTPVSYSVQSFGEMVARRPVAKRFDAGHLSPDLQSL